MVICRTVLMVRILPWAKFFVMFLAAGLERSNEINKINDTLFSADGYSSKRPSYKYMYMYYRQQTNETL